MAIGAALFNDIGGAVSDMFSADAAGIKAEADTIKSQADLLKATGDRDKEQGDLAEASLYDLSSKYAMENADFTAQSTAIQVMQADRQAFLTIGGQKSDVAGSGFAESGSALDVLRDSASQAALSRAVLVQNGAIAEASDKEQSQSYSIMSDAAHYAANADEVSAQVDEMASQIDLKSVAIDKDAQQSDEIGAVLKGVAGVASLFDPLPTAAAGFTPQAPSDPSMPLRINQYAPTEPVSGPQATSLGPLY